ncbi:MAG: hypothetical protein IKS45_02460 [Thermoguttaceae bacterium]|nr:hypothetical protein [Thermoguttaceae bacterium]
MSNEKKRTIHIDHLPGSFFGPPTLVDLLRHRTSHQPDDVAFGFLKDGENDLVEWSYTELDRRARAIAAWFQANDMVGEKAMLLFPPGLDFIAAF